MNLNNYMQRLADFIAARAAETYPEPRSAGHDQITKEWLPKVCKLIPAGGAVLDVGCGSGPALEWLRDNGYSGQGITTNRNDYAACRHAGFAVQLEDMHNLRCVDASMDLVWARHVLEHSIAPLWVLVEFKRALKPSGVLYVEVPAPDTACRHETNQNHYSVLGHGMWVSLLTRSGFEITEATEITFGTLAGPDKYWNFVCRRTP